MHKNDSLLFTLSSDVPVTVIDTSTYYYLVKEIVSSYNEVNTIEKEHLFNSCSLYKNKIAARLFYDQRLNELGEDDVSTTTSVLLFLVKQVDNVTAENYLLLSNDCYVNNAGKVIEAELFNQRVTNHLDDIKKMTDTKNSFLHSRYKD